MKDDKAPTIQYEEIYVDYEQMSNDELDLIEGNVAYILDYARQQSNRELSVTYERQVFGSENTAYDKVIVKDDVIRISRNVKDEQSQVASSLSFKIEENEISIQNGDIREVVRPENSYDSYRQLTYISKIVYDTVAQMQRATKQQ